MNCRNNIFKILLIINSTFLIASSDFFDSFSQYSSNTYTAKSQLLGDNGYSSLRGANSVFLNPANLVNSKHSVSFSSCTSFETLINHSQLSTNFNIYGQTVGIGVATKIIDDIYITNNAWNDNNQDNKINNQTEIDYTKIINSSEKEYLFIIGIPFKISYFDFGLSLKQGYYRLSTYSNYSTSFDLGASFYESDNKRLGFSTIFRNLFLYKKWNRKSTEYFNPIAIESIYYLTDLFKLETSFKHSLANSSLNSISIGAELFILKNNRLILGYTINSYYNLSKTSSFNLGFETEYKNNQLLYGVKILDDFKYEYMFAININYNTFKSIYNISNPLRYL